MRLACVCLAVMVVALNSACGSSSRAATSPIVVAEVQMFSSGAGWAVGVDTTRVTNALFLLRTADGGRHWHDVTPRTGWMAGAAPELLDADHAWLMTFATQGQVSVLRTTDGGAVWRETVIKDPKLLGISSFGLGHITFTDGRYGWLFLAYDYNGDQQGTLYRSSDGGSTWAVASTTDPERGEGNAIPWQGGKQGFGFVDAHTGWLTATSYQSRPLLYVTHDGGVTWNEVSYPYGGGGPIGPSQGVTAPRFLTRSAGYFVIGALESEIYWTFDAGATWSVTLVRACCDYQFVNTRTGFAVGYAVPIGPTDDFSQNLWRTDDGGLHWRIERARINAQTAYEVTNHFHTTISSFEFVDPKVGYAVRDSGPVTLASTASPSPAPSTYRLLKTMDGGATWLNVPYEIE